MTAGQMVRRMFERGEAVHDLKIKEESRIEKNPTALEEILSNQRRFEPAKEVANTLCAGGRRRFSLAAFCRFGEQAHRSGSTWFCIVHLMRITPREM